MQQFAELCEAIARTPKKLEKTRLVTEYFSAHSLDESVQAAIYLSGYIFPAHHQTILNVGGATLWRVIAEVAEGKEKAEVPLAAAYRRHGDLGCATYDVLAPTRDRPGTLSLGELQLAFERIAKTRGSAAKQAEVKKLLECATALEAKYIVKIISGDLRIGLRESLVEEAIAKAYGAPFAQVRRANMFLGDIGETLRLAAERKLSEARMKLFHPLGFMLATPAETSEEALEEFVEAQVEDKFDGIRAQVHCGQDGRVAIFTRTLDDVAGSFPELVSILAAFPESVILDGEILAWQEGHVLPFTVLQSRLGRKRVTPELMRAAPIAYMAFDVLYASGKLVLDEPLRERMKILDRLITPWRGMIHHDSLPIVADPQAQLFYSEVPSETPLNAELLQSSRQQAKTVQELDAIFNQARARGNEGLMIKDLNSPYTPGRRGRSWMKMKRELATLDVVVTGAEYGHGKRAQLISDYTFAVRDGERLVNVGKAYSGVTDEEIRELTEFFKQHTLEDMGHFRSVEPLIVLEVAFNNVMKSDRHESGYALRFPRIVRIRRDKPVGEIDTVARVAEIYEQEKLRERQQGKLIEKFS